MKPLIGFTALLFATSALAQTPPPKVGNKPLVQVKPQAPIGCKLVGTVKGTKLWAGDCTGARRQEALDRRLRAYRHQRCLKPQLPLFPVSSSR